MVLDSQKYFNLNSATMKLFLKITVVVFIPSGLVVICHSSKKDKEPIGSTHEEIQN